MNLAKCVQPGDLILARVISFGDNQASFILSIAEDQLGVVGSCLILEHLFVIGKCN